MITKLILIPNNINDINELRDVGIATFLLPLEKYSIGYKSFKIDEINSIKDNVYLLINRILTTNEIEDLKEYLSKLNNIKGIFYEDLGVFKILKETNLELINFQTHFNNHYLVVNYLLDLGNTSVVIPQDLTYKEINSILENASKEVCLFLFGKNEVMYSRRLLKTNYKKYYKLTKDFISIKERVSGVKFDLVEDDNGTYLFDHNFYNGAELINLPKDNIKYYIINTIHLEINEVLKLLEYLNKNELDKIFSIRENINTGFLHKETIYKVKGE